MLYIIYMMDGVGGGVNKLSGEVYQECIRVISVKGKKVFKNEGVGRGLAHGGVRR